jgi:hypothetical protein
MRTRDGNDEVDGKVGKAKSRFPHLPTSLGNLSDFHIPVSLLLFRKYKIHKNG